MSRKAEPPPPPGRLFAESLTEPETRCPICLKKAGWCAALQLVYRLKFLRGEAVTPTKMLVLRHPIVCRRCRIHDPGGRVRPECECRKCLNRAEMFSGPFPLWFEPAEVNWEELFYD